MKKLQKKWKIRLLALACLPRARPFSLSPTTSKRLLRRLYGYVLAWLIVCFVYFADPNTLRYFYNLGFQVCISTDTLSWTANLRADFHCRVKFTIANRIEAMYERSHVSVKVEPCSTSRFISTLFILPLFCVRDKNLRALMCVAKNASVEINLKGMS